MSIESICMISNIEYFSWNIQSRVWWIKPQTQYPKTIGNKSFCSLTCRQGKDSLVNLFIASSPCDLKYHCAGISCPELSEDSDVDITSIRGISGSRRYLEGNAELNLPLPSPTTSRVPFPLCSVPSSMEPTTALSTPEVLPSFLTSLFSPSLVVLPTLEPLSLLHFPQCTNFSI